jgi:N-acetylmuramic acid 6-phosphate etherase
MNLGSLVSETRNPQTMDLDALSTFDLVSRFNQQDMLVAQAVKETLPEVAKAVDAAAASLKAGGRIIYMGAGTSGRLGVLDASECPPTFGVPHGLVIGLIAGGPGALLKAVEGAEDSKQLGEEDLRELALSPQDLVVGLAASGRTPYVIGDGRQSHAGYLRRARSLPHAPGSDLQHREYPDDGRCAGNGRYAGARF